MKNVLLFIAKLLMKMSFFLAWAFVSALNFIIVICCVTLRYIALPIMFVAAVIAATTYFDHGLTRDVLECIGTFAAAGAFYFALPQLPKLLAFAQGFFRAGMKIPLYHKRTSQLKYTF